jgi:hypothetical protein
MTTDADGGERAGLSPGELRHAPPSGAVAAIGSAWVQTWVSAWGEDDATVTTRTWLTTGTELTVDLAWFLEHTVLCRR